MTFEIEYNCNLGTFLDNASCPPIPAEIQKAHQNLLSSNLIPSPHSDASTRLRINIIRERVLRSLRVENGDTAEWVVIFTANASAALKMVAEQLELGKTISSDKDEQSLSASDAEFLSCDSKNDPESVQRYYTRSKDLSTPNSLNNLSRFPCLILTHNHTSILAMAPVLSFMHNKPLDEFVAFVSPQDLSLYLSYNKSERNNISPLTLTPNRLLIYPAQCNFSGRIFSFPHNNKYTILVDTTSFCATNSFDLPSSGASIAVLSFYKMFGFPTGLGALVIKSKVLDSFRGGGFMGGGTVSGMGIGPFWNKRKRGPDGFEDGTAAFHSILSLEGGYNFVETLGGFAGISSRVKGLGNAARQMLKNLRHFNGNQVAILYSNEDSSIVTFNILTSSGLPISPTQFGLVALNESIHLRTGRFCNAGAAQHYLGLSSEFLKILESAGLGCGSAVDVINGQVVGAIRASFGICNSLADVKNLESFIKTYFVDLEIEGRGDSNLNVGQCISLEVVEEWIYPIKSCRGIRIPHDTWPVRETGYYLDRKYMLVSSLDMKPVTLGVCTALASIRCELVKDDLVIKAVGMTDLIIKPKTSSKDHVKESKWFSDFVGFNVIFTESQTPEKPFSNKSPFLLVTSASIEKLSGTDPSFSHISTRSFRPNLVVKTVVPFEELGWVGKTIWVRGMLFRVDGMCERCGVVNIDENGKRHKEPLRTLAKHRVQGKIVFGVYMSLKEGNA